MNLTIQKEEHRMTCRKKYDPIKIRFRTLKNGNRSIYLDYKVDGKRVAEYLKMYLLPGRSPEVKRLNEHTLRAVSNIKALRLTNIAWDKEANDGVADSKRMLFDVIDEYAEFRFRRGTKSARSTYGNLKRHISFISSDLRLWEVNLDFVSALAENMMNREHTTAGEHLAHATITGTISALGSVLRYAVRKRMISCNPVDLYDTSKVQGPVYKRIYLIADELKALVRTECSVEMYKQLFLFACFVGLRYSDLITLRWGDVIEEYGELRIEKMMHKTRHMVYIPLGRIAKDYLPARRDCDEFVFPDLPRNIGVIDAVIRQWAADAGIEKKVTFYSSRHTFATLNLTQGADLYVVSQLLGHKEIRTTEGYAEIIDVKRMEAMYMIDSLFPEYLSKNKSES